MTDRVFLSFQIRRKRIHCWDTAIASTMLASCFKYDQCVIRADDLSQNLKAKQNCTKGGAVHCLQLTLI